MASRIFVANAIGLCAFLADVIAEQRWIEFTERALQWESYLEEFPRDMSRRNLACRQSR